MAELEVPDREVKTLETIRVRLFHDALDDSNFDHLTSLRRRWIRYDVVGVA